MMDGGAAMPRDLSALLVPLVDDLLLLPSAVVVEIIRRRELIRPVAAPSWLLGMLHWHDTTIPVLCFEALNGAGLSDTGHGGRIVIMSVVGESPPCEHYAILAQGVPHLLLLTDGDVLPDAERQPGSMELMKVQAHGRDAAIPDLDAVEAALRQWCLSG